MQKRSKKWQNDTLLGATVRTDCLAQSEIKKPFTTIPNFVKTCSRCGRTKETSEFRNHPNTSDGLNSWCKSCARAYNAARRWEPRPIAMQMYHDILRRCGNKDGKHPAYANVHCLISRERFLEIVPPLIKEYWSYNPGQRPSIDRINPNKDYSEGNIRVISWWLNKKLARREGFRRKSHSPSMIPFVSDDDSPGFTVGSIGG